MNDEVLDKIRAAYKQLRKYAEGLEARIIKLEVELARKPRTNDVVAQIAAEKAFDQTKAKIQMINEEIRDLHTRYGLAHSSPNPGHEKALEKIRELKKRKAELREEMMR